MRVIQRRLRPPLQHHRTLHETPNGEEAKFAVTITAVRLSHLFHYYNPRRDKMKYFGTFQIMRRICNSSKTAQKQHAATQRIDKSSRNKLF